MLRIRLKELRENKKLSQRALADDLGIRQSTVGNWESGVREPKHETLKKLADYFNVSIDYLLGYSDDPIDYDKIADLPGNIVSEYGPEVAYKVQKATDEDVWAERAARSPIPKNDNIRCAVRGNVAAGYGAIAFEDVIDHIDIPRSWFHNQPIDQFFFLSVSGDSMAPYYLDGDIVMCHKQSSVDSGQVAVVLFDSEEATLKKIRYKQHEDWFEMIPLNESYETKRISGPEIESCRVLGLVWRLIRRIEH